MAERPLLILPAPGQRPRRKKSGGDGDLPIPCRQEERLDTQFTVRGAIRHEVWRGTRAHQVPGRDLDIQVSCREDAGTLEDSVPYALAVTLEVADTLRIDLYGPVRAAIEAMRVAVPAAP